MKHELIALLIGKWQQYLYESLTNPLLPCRFISGRFPSIVAPVCAALHLANLRTGYSCTNMCITGRFCSAESSRAPSLFLRSPVASSADLPVALTQQCALDLHCGPDPAQRAAAVDPAIRFSIATNCRLIWCCRQGSAALFAPLSHSSTTCALNSPVNRRRCAMWHPFLTRVYTGFHLPGVPFTGDTTMLLALQ